MMVTFSLTINSQITQKSRGTVCSLKWNFSICKKILYTAKDFVLILQRLPQNWNKLQEKNDKSKWKTVITFVCTTSLLIPFVLRQQHLGAGLMNSEQQCKSLVLAILLSAVPRQLISRGQFFLQQTKDPRWRQEVQSQHPRQGKNNYNP